MQALFLGEKENERRRGDGAGQSPAEGEKHFPPCGSCFSAREKADGSGDAASAA